MNAIRPRWPAAFALVMSLTLGSACAGGADSPPVDPTTTSAAEPSGENQLIPVERARSVADQMDDRSSSITLP